MEREPEFAVRKELGIEVRADFTICCADSGALAIVAARMPEVQALVASIHQDVKASQKARGIVEASPEGCDGC